MNVGTSMTAKPVVDLRTYTIRRRSMDKFLSISDTLAMPVQLRHIGPPLAYYVTDIGPQNQVIHLWPYESVGDMEERRIARNKDPDWQIYVAASQGIILEQETRVVRRVPFKGVDELSATVADKPLVDFRIYTIQRGSMPEFLRISETLAMPVQLRHLGPPLAYYLSEIGPQNQVIHLWGYDSLADLETRRAARNRDPEWAIYLKASEGLILEQETRAVRRVPFASLKHLRADQR